MQLGQWKNLKQTETTLYISLLRESQFLFKKVDESYVKAISLELNHIFFVH